MATKLVAILEQLNSAPQAKSANVSGMLEAVRIASTHISTTRTDMKSFMNYSLLLRKNVKNTNWIHWKCPRNEFPQKDTQEKQLSFKLRILKHTTGSSISSSLML